MAQKAVTSEKRGNLVSKYLREAWEEINKVTWPTRDQAIRMTIIVLIITFIIMVVIGVLDWLFALGYDETLKLLS